MGNRKKIMKSVATQTENKTDFIKSKSKFFLVLGCYVLHSTKKIKNYFKNINLKVNNYSKIWKEKGKFKR